ncbi:MAG TPA: crosslink repair DNA glycosylase YcaQ family protein [Actinomycetota bacterium]|nr:crosslink repair DNA glycosylase YcaQ family protein [Actinomycetota bacterium]
MTTKRRGGPSDELSADEARSIALAAQGLTGRPASKPGVAGVRRVVRRLHALQLDSVNVLVRSHYLPVFSRLGPYPMTDLDRLVNKTHELLELDAHQASFVPAELEPLFRWRRRWSDWETSGPKLRRERPGYVEAIERHVADHGPIALSDLEDKGSREKPKTKYAESSLMWWRPSDGKSVLDGLVSTGRFALAGRRGFARLYDLRERVIPPEVLAQPAPPAEDAIRTLVELAARALGVATVGDLAGYFFLKVGDTKKAARDLVEQGSLRAARVQGWKDPVYVHTSARAAPSLEARTLLSPFDSLTWSRDRTKRLFGFDFSFEIYVPAPERRYGYYVLPFLLRDRLVARVDLKSDRKRSTLLVQAAFGEAGTAPKEVAAELARELGLMAGWLGLERVEVGERGDLARPLARAVKPRLVR